MTQLRIFDLDGTLLHGNSSFRFFFYLIKTRRLPVFSFFRVIPLMCAFRRGKLTVTQLHHRVFNMFFKGRPKSLFSDAVEPFLDRFLLGMINSKVAFLLYRDPLNLVNLKGSQNSSANPTVPGIHNLPKTLLLSSSPDFLVGPIARRLGIENWKGSEYGVDKEMVFCKISSLIEGREKLRLARSFAQQWSISAEKVAAYSDSDDDLPLLEWAGTACAVKPNKMLLKAAAKRGWKVI